MSSKARRCLYAPTFLESPRGPHCEGPRRAHQAPRDRIELGAGSGLVGYAFREYVCTYEALTVPSKPCACCRSQVHRRSIHHDPPDGWPPAASSSSAAQYRSEHAQFPQFDSRCAKSLILGPVNISRDSQPTGYALGRRLLL